ncbi:phosphomannomutase [uncultured Thiothrix sp.]|uniref:phosphomannomutase n=1 Tax=uncultured Thiothrix sp. TaxID=223185 RepID=UPI002615E37E|nr:phosphomannomutase [uncultured Thiothrix sp.]
MTPKIILAEQYPQVVFGTSGVRALVCDLTPQTISAYIYAFMQRMQHTHAITNKKSIAVGMDLRPSSPHIAAAVSNALLNLGYQTTFLGSLPTPALALHCLSKGIPGIIVTGSHIPFDRNGLKFYSPDGEILKEDEQAISTCVIPKQWLDTLKLSYNLSIIDKAASQAYIQRYVTRFGKILVGWRIGLYEHSAAGRDLTKAVLHKLGATVISLGRSDKFVPIDTEAVNDDDLHQAEYWCSQHHLDALVSTDGDGDRPLVFDANGQFIRGDILGLLCAKYLGLTTLAIPINCTTAIEKTQAFKNILRTRIGSPYVVQAMNNVQNQDEFVGGFEANGGFLLRTNLPGLNSLPTRDALLPIVTVLGNAARQNLTLSMMLEQLPARYTYSARLKDTPFSYSKSLLDRLLSDHEYIKNLFPEKFGLSSIDITDGVRLTFDDEDIVHLRPSGNAPELRCYTETSSLESAKLLCITTLSHIQSQLNHVLD